MQNSSTQDSKFRINKIRRSTNVHAEHCTSVISCLDMMMITVTQYITHWHLTYRPLPTWCARWQPSIHQNLFSILIYTFVSSAHSITDLLHTRYFFGSYNMYDLVSYMHNYMLHCSKVSLNNFTLGFRQSMPDNEVNQSANTAKLSDAATELNSKLC